MNKIYKVLTLFEFSQEIGYNYTIVLIFLMTDLKNVKIFEGVPENIVETILANIPKETFIPWQMIIVEGDASNGKWYLIESGEVIVSIKDQEITSLWIGEIFGEIALLNEENRTATVKAKTDVSLIVISQENLMHLMNSNDDINKEILRRIEENIKHEGTENSEL